MQEALAIRRKVEELSHALKAEGLWKQQEPEWVKNYRSGHEFNQADFFDWLQFVYLPNRHLSQRSAGTSGETYITLQAKKFAGEKMASEKIVRLLVELDSLTG